MKRIRIKRKIWIPIVVVLVILGAFVFFSMQQARQTVSTAFQTAEIKHGDLTAMVGATGTVRSNQSTVLAWQTSGIIEDITVKVGDSTQTGQLLAQLKDSSLSQSIILAQADLVDAKHNLDNLKNSDLARAQAQQALVEAQKAYDDAVEKRESKQYLRSSQDTLDVARANLIIAEDAVTQAEINYDRFDSLPEDNAMRAEAFSQLAKARQQRDKALGNLNWLLGKPDAQEVAEADATVEVAKAKLGDAQREWDRLKNGPDPNDIRSAEARVAALEATVGLSKLEATFNGTVTEVNSKEGDQVAAGFASFQIDDLSHLLVDVEVPEVDINRVKVGQPAKLTFDAIPDKDYDGRVIEVSKVGALDQGVVNFTITVELSNADENVLPGMTAGVNIVVSQLENVLLVPNRAVRLRSNERVVYLLVNGVPTPKNITLGVSSETFSEVTGGELKEGDVVILNPPAGLDNAGGPPFAAREQ